MTELPTTARRLTVETALSQSQLTGHLRTKQQRGCTVAVIGDGHAAVLALRNLLRLATESHPLLRVKWLARRTKLRYAGEDDDGVVRHEFDGLMGQAAWFAHRYLEGGRLEKGDAAQYIQRVVLPGVEGVDQGGMGRRGQPVTERKGRERGGEERAVLEKELQGVDYVVQCVGFARARLPDLQPGLTPDMGRLGKPRRVMFNAGTGSFFSDGEEPDKVIGLFGAGSAFPQAAFTSQGWKQSGVSVGSFMEFLKRMVPLWVDATQRGRFAEEEGRGVVEKERTPWMHQHY
jgi:hypothetical protein